MKMKLLKSLLIAVLITVPVLADGGSLYTRKGIGDLYFALSARRLALGGGGIALNSTNDISILNPASWFSIKKTRFDAGLFVNNLYLESSSSSVKYSQTNLYGFSFAAPIDTANGIVFAGGLTPYSNVFYEVEYRKTDQYVGDYSASYEGNGGINKLFFGLTAKLPLNFVLGAAFEYYYGEIEYNSSMTIDDDEFYNGIFTNSNNYQGRGINVGILSPDLSSIFGTDDITNFRIGAAVDYIFSMKRDSSEISGNSDSTYISYSVNQTIDVPTRFSFGAAMKLFKRYQVVADYIYQPFEQYKVDGTKPGIYQNLHRISGGLEYTNPSPKKDSFWDRIALRLGFSYEQSQYKMNGVSLSQYAIHAGFSIPLSSENSIDVAFQYGKRGTTDNSLIKETFYNLDFGISLGELWFQKIER